MKKTIPAAYKKIILFGDKQTGKSCFIKSLENNPFNEFYSQTKSRARRRRLTPQKTSWFTASLEDQ